jgi:hypothetical protein
MNYTKGHIIRALPSENRFFETIKKKWKNFTMIK